MAKFTVGQEVWIRKARHGQGDPWRRTEITRVGRKYVYANDPEISWREVKFDLAGYEAGGYSGIPLRIYTDEGRARLERLQVARGRLRDLGVDMGYKNRFSLEAQEAVADLLEADLRDENREG